MFWQQVHAVLFVFYFFWHNCKMLDKAFRKCEYKVWVLLYDCWAQLEGTGGFLVIGTTMEVRKSALRCSVLKVSWARGLTHRKQIA